MMDGAPNVTGNKPPHKVEVKLDPNITTYADRVDDYTPIWPCPHDYISIKV